MIQWQHRMKLVFCLVLISPLLEAQPELSAGVARVDISPAKGHAMAGYPERTRGAAGVHDPIQATVLLLESAEVRVALVACDLATFTSPRIATLAREKFGVAHTILALSGTHSGPAASGKWIASAEDKILDAIGEARKSMFPAEIIAAAGRAYLGFNRRKVQNDGTARLWERNPEMLPSHPLDPTVTVIGV